VTPSRVACDPPTQGEPRPLLPVPYFSRLRSQDCSNSQLRSAARASKDWHVPMQARRNVSTAHVFVTPPHACGMCLPSTPHPLPFQHGACATPRALCVQVCVCALGVQAHASTRKHTQAHASTRKHTQAHASTRKHTQAHASTRKHTQAHASTAHVLSKHGLCVEQSTPHVSFVMCHAACVHGASRHGA
jgi:hypothetical protein